MSYTEFKSGDVANVVPSKLAAWNAADYGSVTMFNVKAVRNVPAATAALTGHPQLLIMDTDDAYSGAWFDNLEV